MLFNTPAKGLELIKKPQAIKHTDDRKSEIPADDSEKQPGSGCEQADGELKSLTKSLLDSQM